MADRIAIMGGEPYAEWIERDDQAQRLFKATRNAWHSATSSTCVSAMEKCADFDDEWCAQCGTPIDPDSSEYYSCVRCGLRG